MATCLQNTTSCTSCPGWQPVGGREEEEQGKSGFIRGQQAPNTTTITIAAFATVAADSGALHHFALNGPRIYIAAALCYAHTRTHFLLFVEYYCITPATA